MLKFSTQPDASGSNRTLKSEIQIENLCRKNHASQNSYDVSSGTCPLRLFEFNIEYGIIFKLGKDVVTDWTEDIGLQNPNYRTSKTKFENQTAT